MKHARKRWLALIAICLGVASPAWSQSDAFTADPYSGAGPFAFSDESGSVRLGQSPSGSVTQVQGEFSVPAQGPDPFAPEAVLGPVAPEYSGTTFVGDGGLGYASMAARNEIFWRMGRVNIDQYGYDGGYTQFNAFVPLFGSPNDTLFWVNPRINVTDYGLAAANLGGGIRKYSPGRDRVWGASAWWDFDDGHSRSFSQVGGSFESIGEYFSLRGNFAVPVGETTAKFNVQNVPGGTSFTGKNISILQSFMREDAYESYDVEAAVPMPFLGQYGFDFGIGAYVLNNSEVGSATGVSARAQAQISENFWLNTIYTYDKVFDSMASVNFEYTIPTRRASRWFRRAPVQSYMTQSVQRRYRVPVRQTEGTQTILATKNGAIINVAFIDPNDINDPEHFDSVFQFDNDVDKADYQLIYVFRRTDDTDANLNTGITLLDDQILVGQGLNRSITTDQGVVALPSSDGPAPLLTNSGAADPTRAVITLANNNEVVGFRIDGGNTADGISGTAIQSFNIHDNAIENIINGINITTNTGAGLNSYGIIENNSVAGNTNLDNDYPSSSGISVTHQGMGILDLLIRGNVIRGIDEDANANGILNDETTAGVDQDFDGIIDADEDLNGNGIRDGVGIRVLAERGTINASAPTVDGGETGILNNTVLRSANGIEVLVAPAPGESATIDLTMNGNTVAQSTAPMTDGGKAFLLSTDGTNGTSVLNLYSFQNNTTSDNDGDGLILDIISQGQLNFLGTPTFQGNDLAGNAGTGMTFNIIDSQVQIGSLSNLTITGNDGGGLAINVDGVTSTFEVLSPIVGSTFSGNGGDGLVVSASNGATVDMYFGYQSQGATFGNTFTGNGSTVGVPTGSGLVLRATDGGQINTALVGNTFTGNSENGVVIDAQTGGVIDLTGKAFAQTDGSIWVSNGIVGRPTGAVRSQNFSGNGVHGLAILASNGGNVIVPFMNGNSFNDNGEAGLYIGSLGGIVNPAASSVTIDSAVENLFNRTGSGTSGILLNTQNVDIVLTNLLRNQFIGGNANTAFGIGGVVNGGSMELELVTPNNANRNQFADNRGAHIGIIFEGDATADVKIENGTFTNALADSINTDNFNGDGVALIARDTATLTGSIRGSTFTGNAGNGILLALGGANADPGLSNFAQLNNFIIDQNILGTTAAGQGNGMNGIEILRDIRGNVNNLTVSRNTAMGNLNGAGLKVTSANSDYLDVGRDTFYAWGNVFSNNQNGIELKVMGDADMFANIGFAQSTPAINATVAQRNFIENNSMNGILAWEQSGTTADSRSISGTWTNNVIRYNADDGIDFRTNAGDPINNLNGGLFIGVGPVNNTIYGTNVTNGNIIAYNGRDGIDITGGGLYTIAHNTIAYNGTDTGFNNLGMAGLNVTGSMFETGGQPSSSVFTPITAYYQNVIAYNNVISSNNGDGVQWIAEPSYDSNGFAYDSRLELTNNAINSNTGRGIDMLMRPTLDTDPTDSDNTDPDVGRIAGIVGAFPSINFGNIGEVRGEVLIQQNQVAGNQQEGIYLVTSNSGNQSAATTSSTILEQTGSIGAAYHLTIDILENQINGNGNAVTNFPATGLVMRIGTTAGVSSMSDTQPYNPFSPYAQDAPFAIGGISGVVATVENNRFSGNQGDDFFVHSFTSTVDPGTTTGTWSATEFTVTFYQADPLARLDLIFGGNIMDSMTANNENTTTNVTPDNQVGAFYSNADPFKSRLNTFTGTTPNGPFSSNARRRNATRLRSDWRSDPGDPSTGTLNPDPPAQGGTWEYDGMGNSTFRIRYSATNTIGGVLIGAPGALFNLDDPGIITGAGMANGFGFTGPNLFGELPFGWGQF
ncbi:beta strand repeat-containing protein [Planctomicrobium sp. SH527]|uniref:beta strand repeat-containing protein n=1 Tax=Planctomicrobium sp. SH527 TaxID=3448123 RepID=UPI003F5B497E